MPHISIKAEPIFEIFNFPVTNSLIASVLVVLLIFALAFFYYVESKKKKKNLYFYLINTVLHQLYNLFGSVVEDKKNVFFPLLGALFVYILIQNWMGLLPGFGSILIKVEEHGEEVLAPILRGGSADLNTTLALSLVAVTMIQFYGIYFLGLKAYIGKFINLKSPISFFLGILEVVSEISRVISFSFRLFGNIFAGEVLLAIIAFLVPVIASFPFLMLELFVGMIQALVFSMLTAVFLRMAITSHH